MTTFLQEFLSLLTQQPGNLIYHIVLAFSVAAALPTTWIFARSFDHPYARRVLVGLIPILLALLVAFLIGSLSWQGVLSENNLLPALDRGVTLFSLVLIIWLWAYPEPARFADIATLLLTLVITSLTAVNIAWWSFQTDPAPYNSVLVERFSQILALLFIVIGIVQLAIRRPHAWANGFFMLAILFAGHLVQLAFPDLQGNFAGPVRLAQIIAYPLLLTLPQRFISPAKMTPQPATVAEMNPKAQVGVLEPNLPFVIQESLPELYKEIMRNISKTMRAGVCLLIAPPNENWQLTVLAGFDDARNENLPEFKLDGNQIPIISAALKHNRLFRIPESKTTSDLINLAAALHLEHTGDLIGAPVVEQGSSPSLGIILLSPYTERSWGKEDQVALEGLAKSLAHLLQQKRVQEELVAGYQKMRQSYQDLENELQLVQQEKQALLVQLAETQAFVRQVESKSSEVMLNLTNNMQDQETIARLKAEIEQMKQAMAASSPEKDALEGELKLTLEEIARLRSAPESVEVKPVKKFPYILSESQLEDCMKSMLQVRQPLSAIAGYTDFLLGESIGILGALQRKFLERIRSATEQMTALLDEFQKLTNQEATSLQLEPQAVQLSEVIDNALMNCGDMLRSKGIALRIDLPTPLPQLQIDRNAIEQVITSLITNASSVTPQEGQISLHAEVKGEADKGGYVLFQVADQGGGIAAEDMPNVFSRLYHAPISGVGDSGAGLSIIKVLVEACGGRIWVDSEPGVGSLFSILLPVFTMQSTSKTRDGEWNLEA